ncbi:MAG TPA: nitroreductase [Epulopiscium sp.]|nr:nitroreductase [Candidatus Epulonipiscium sp.]
MEVMYAIKNRRSIRKYLGMAVESEKLENVAIAFRMAPSAKNLQNHKLLIVQDSKLKEKIREASPSKAPMLTQAPAILVAVGFSQDTMTCGHRIDSIDLSIAMSFAILEAYAEGLGTCWMANFDEDRLRTALNLPSGSSIVAISPIGYADEMPNPKPRKLLENIVEYL